MSTNIKRLLLCFFLGLAIANAQNYTYEKKITDSSYTYTNYTIKNTTDGVKTRGTLVYKQPDFKKLIILVSGSGKDKRNAHYKLAQNLVEAGYAVYRFDDRGVGASGGNFFAGIAGFDTDVLSIVTYFKTLPEFSNKSIGVIAHSLGGAITLKAIEQGAAIDFYIMLSAPVGDYAKMLEFQFDHYPKQFQVTNEQPAETYQLIQQIHKVISNNSSLTNKEIREKVITFFKEARLKNYNKMYTSYWYIDIAKQNFTNTFNKTSIPSLWCYAAKDSRIDAVREQQLVESNKTPLITTMIFPELNHYFYKGKANPYEMDTVVINTLTNWLANH